MFCTKCGTENDCESVYCKKCGNKLIEILGENNVFDENNEIIKKSEFSKSFQQSLGDKLGSCLGNIILFVVIMIFVFIILK